MPNDKNELISWITENVAMAGRRGRTMDDLWSSLTTRTNYTNSIETLWTLIVSELDLTLSMTMDHTSSKAIPMSDLNHSTYETTKAKYGAPLYWTATLRDQIHYLLLDQQVTLPPLQLDILEKIGWYGATGVAQCVITTDLGLKPQTVFHHLKKLQSLALIKKTPSIYQGQYTNTCVHARYSKSVDDTKTTNHSTGPIAPDGSIRYDVTAERMNQLLLQADDNIMALSDLVRLAGFTHEKHLKWARHFLTKQHSEGFVEKRMATANGKKTTYVRLIKPISIADGNVDSSTANSIDGDQNKDSCQISAQHTSPVTIDAIAAYIASRNGNGCTNKELLGAFPNTSKSTISTLVKKLKTAKDSDLVAIKELQGRSHVYYYFSKDGFRQYQRNKSGSHESAQLDNERNAQVESSSTIEKKRRSTSPIPSTSKRNKVDNSTAGNVNLTATRRKAALLEIINRDRIRDFNVQLFDEIQAMDGSDMKHKLARRTAQRLVDGLEKQGLLRLIKIVPNSFFGGNQPRTLVLSPELDESHQEVKDHLENKQREAPVSANRETSSTNEQPPNIDTPVKRYGRGRYTMACSEKYWRYVAKRHGWMESKWLRAKELHLFLVKLLLQIHGGVWDNERWRTIPLIDMITMMPFEVYKKVIGIHQYDETVEAYVETNQVPTVTLADIPDDIKRRIIPNPYQMRRRVQSLLVILEKLDLIRPLTPTSTQNGNTPTPSSKIAYTLQLNGAIRNYILPDRPILANKPLTDMDLVVDFWNELQYTCACVYGTESDQSGISRTNKNDNDPLSTITLSRTWVNGDIITAEQKRCLDQHVDYSLEQVPTGEWALFLQLSRATGLLPYRIRSYYLNLGNAFAKRRILEQQQQSAEELDKNIIQQLSTSSIKGKRKRQSMGTTTPWLLQASKQNQRLSQVPDNVRQHTASFSAPTFVGSRSFRRTYVKNLDESIARKDQPTGKRTIQGFTSTEKSTFLYAMAIMRHRKHQGGKFYWAPMTLVIPTKSVRQCASHLHSLSATSLRKIDDLQSKWARIYTRGLETKEICDERSWDTKDFDLAGYLEYFLAQLLLEDTSTPTIDTSIRLPATASVIHSICTVTPTFHPKDTQDWPDITTSHSMSKTSWKNSVSDEKSKELTNTIQLIKMIMVHSEESFDSHLAYSLLSHCPADSIEKAYLYLKNAGIVVLSKHGDTRGVPGRKFRMSNKFILSLTGPVSRELYDAALDFQHHIVNGQRIPKQLDDGMMVSLLNLISQNKITIYNQASDQLWELLASGNYPKPNRFHGKLIEQWINKHTDLCIRIDESNPLTTRLIGTKGRMNQPIEMISSLEAQQYLEKQPLKSDKDIETIYMALDMFGTNGASSVELKSKLKSLGKQVSDQDMLAALQTLMCHTPSLVVRVGNDDLRWICVPHAKSWMIKVPTTVDTETDTYVQPNMWTNLDGTVNQNMLYACGSSLLGHILRKPGITQDQLEDIFYDTMSRAECQQVLDALLDHEIIYSHSTLRQQRTSLFSKPLLMNLKSTVAPSDTCYFTTPDYYCKLDLLKGKH